MNTVTTTTAADTAASTKTTLINVDATLNELLAVLGDVTRAERKPGAVALQEQERLVAESQDGRIRAYANGYASYKNDVGRTVVFVPDCKSYRYDFDQHLDPDIKDSDEEDASEFPWMVAIALRAESQIEYHAFGYSDDRKDGKKDDEDSANDNKKEDDGKGARPAHFPDPLLTVVLREEVKARLSRLTKKEQETLIWVHTFGYTQQEIADHLKIAQQVVGNRLLNAEDKFGGRDMAENLLSKVELLKGVSVA